MTDNGSNRPGSGKVERVARLTMVPLGELQPSLVAQRNKLNQGRVDHICAHLDLEQIGNPTVNAKNGSHYIIDGWHRVEALKQFGFHDDDKIEVWTYYNLTEQQEARRFLTLNDTLRVDGFSKFKVSVNAEMPRETNINNILGSLGLRVGTNASDDASVHCPGTLIKVYDKHGPVVLSRALKIIRDAFGNSGLEAVLIEGVALVVARFDKELKDLQFTTKLSGIRGGSKGLINKAQQLKLQTGAPKPQCVAAALVEHHNSGRTLGKRLTPWWKAVAQDQDRPRAKTLADI